MGRINEASPRSILDCHLDKKTDSGEGKGKTSHSICCARKTQDRTNLKTGNGRSTLSMPFKTSYASQLSLLCLQHLEMIAREKGKKSATSASHPISGGGLWLDRMAFLWIEGLQLSGLETAAAGVGRGSLSQRGMSVGCASSNRGSCRGASTPDAPCTAIACDFANRQHIFVRVCEPHAWACVSVRICVRVHLHLRMHVSV